MITKHNRQSLGNKIDGFPQNKKVLNNLTRSLRKRKKHVKNSNNKIVNRWNNYTGNNDINEEDTSLNVRLPIWRVSKSTLAVINMDSTTNPSIMETKIINRPLLAFEKPPSQLENLDHSVDKAIFPIARRYPNSRRLFDLNASNKNLILSRITSPKSEITVDVQNSAFKGLNSSNKRYLLVPISKNLYVLKNVRENSRTGVNGIIISKRYKLLEKDKDNATSANLSFKAHMHHDVKDVGRAYRKKGNLHLFDHDMNYLYSTLESRVLKENENPTKNPVSPSHPDFLHPDIAFQTDPNLIDVTSKIFEEQIVSPIPDYENISLVDINSRSRINFYDSSTLSSPSSFDISNYDVASKKIANYGQLSTFTFLSEATLNEINPIRQNGGNYGNSLKYSEFGVELTTTDFRNTFDTLNEYIYTPATLKDVEIDLINDKKVFDTPQSQEDDSKFLTESNEDTSITNFIDDISTQYRAVFDASANEDNIFFPNITNHFVNNGILNSQDIDNQKYGISISSEYNNKMSTHSNDLYYNNRSIDEVLFTNYTTEVDSFLNKEDYVTSASLLLNTDEILKKAQSNVVENSNALLMSIKPLSSELQKLLGAIQLVNQSISNVQSRLCDKKNVGSARTEQESKNRNATNITKLVDKVDYYDSDFSIKSFNNQSLDKRHIEIGDKSIAERDVKIRRRTIFLNKLMTPFYKHKSSISDLEVQSGRRNFLKKRKLNEREFSKSGDKLSHSRFNRNLKSLTKNYETRMKPIRQFGLKKMKRTTPILGLSRLIKSDISSKNFEGGRQNHQKNHQISRSIISPENTFFLNMSGSDKEKKFHPIDPQFYKEATAYLDILELLGKTKKVEYATEIWTTQKLTESLPSLIFTTTEFFVPTLTFLPYFIEAPIITTSSTIAEEKEIFEITKSSLYEYITSPITLSASIIPMSTTLPLFYMTKLTILSMEETAISITDLTITPVVAITEVTEIPITIPMIEIFTTESVMLLTAFLEDMTDITLKITVPVATETLIEEIPALTVVTEREIMENISTSLATEITQSSFIETNISLYTFSTLLETTQTELMIETTTFIVSVLTSLATASQIATSESVGENITLYKTESTTAIASSPMVLKQTETILSTSTKIAITTLIPEDESPVSQIEKTITAEETATEVPTTTETPTPTEIIIITTETLTTATEIPMTIEATTITETSILTEILTTLKTPITEETTSTKTSTLSTTSLKIETTEISTTSKTSTITETSFIKTTITEILPINKTITTAETPTIETSTASKILTISTIPTIIATTTTEILTSTEILTTLKTPITEETTSTKTSTLSTTSLKTTEISTIKTTITEILPINKTMTTAETPTTIETSTASKILTISTIPTTIATTMIEIFTTESVMLLTAFLEDMTDITLKITVPVATETLIEEIPALTVVTEREIMENISTSLATEITQSSFIETNISLYTFSTLLETTQTELMIETTTFIVSVLTSLATASQIATSESVGENITLYKTESTTAIASSPMVLKQTETILSTSTKIAITTLIPEDESPVSQIEKTITAEETATEVPTTTETPTPTEIIIITTETLTTATEIPMTIEATTITETSILTEILTTLKTPITEETTSTKTSTLSTTSLKIETTEISTTSKTSTITETSFIKTTITEILPINKTITTAETPTIETSTASKILTISTIPTIIATTTTEILTSTVILTTLKTPITEETTSTEISTLSTTSLKTTEISTIKTTITEILPINKTVTTAETPTTIETSTASKILTISTIPTTIATTITTEILTSTEILTTLKTPITEETTSTEISTLSTTSLKTTEISTIKTTITEILPINKTMTTAETPTTIETSTASKILTISTIPTTIATTITTEILTSTEILTTYKTPIIKETGTTIITPTETTLMPIETKTTIETSTITEITTSTKITEFLTTNKSVITPVGTPTSIQILTTSEIPTTSTIPTTIVRTTTITETLTPTEILTTYTTPIIKKTTGAKILTPIETSTPIEIKTTTETSTIIEISTTIETTTISKILTVTETLTTTETAFTETPTTSEISMTSPIPTITEITAITETLTLTEIIATTKIPTIKTTVSTKGLTPTITETPSSTETQIITEILTITESLGSTEIPVTSTTSITTVFFTTSESTTSSMTMSSKEFFPTPTLTTLTTIITTETAETILIPSTTSIITLLQTLITNTTLSETLYTTISSMFLTTTKGAVTTSFKTAIPTTSLKVTTTTPLPLVTSTMSSEMPNTTLSTFLIEETTVSLIPTTASSFETLHTKAALPIPTTVSTIETILTISSILTVNATVFTTTASTITEEILKSTISPFTYLTVTTPSITQIPIKPIVMDTGTTAYETTSTLVTSSLLTETITGTTSSIIEYEETKETEEYYETTREEIATVTSTAKLTTTEHTTWITTKEVTIEETTPITFFTTSFSVETISEATSPVIETITLFTITKETLLIEKIVTVTPETMIEVTLISTETSTMPTIETSTTSTSLAAVATTALLLEETATEITETSLITTATATLLPTTKRPEYATILEAAITVTLAPFSELILSIIITSETPVTTSEVISTLSTTVSEEFTTSTTESPSITYTTQISILLIETTISPIVSISTEPTEESLEAETEYYVAKEPFYEEEYEEYEEYDTEIPTDKWYYYDEYETTTKETAMTEYTELLKEKATSPPFIEGTTTSLYKIKTSEFTKYLTHSETASTYINVTSTVATPEISYTEKITSTSILETSTSTIVENVTTVKMETELTASTVSKEESTTMWFTFGSTEEYTLPSSTTFKIPTDSLDYLTIPPRYTVVERFTQIWVTTPKFITKPKEIPKIALTTIPEQVSETETTVEKLTSFFISSTQTTLPEREVIEVFATTTSTVSSEMESIKTVYEVITSAMTGEETIPSVTPFITSEAETEITTIKPVFTTMSKTEREQKEQLLQQLLQQLDNLKQYEKEIMEREERLKEKEKQWDIEKKKRLKMMQREKEKEKNITVTTEGYPTTTTSISITSPIYTIGTNLTMPTTEIEITSPGFEISITTLSLVEITTVPTKTTLFSITEKITSEIYTTEEMEEITTEESTSVTYTPEKTIIPYTIKKTTSITYITKEIEETQITDYITLTPYVTTSIMDLYNIGLASIETATSYATKEMYTVSYVFETTPFSITEETISVTYTMERVTYTTEEAIEETTFTPYVTEEIEETTFTPYVTEEIEEALYTTERSTTITYFTEEIEEIQITDYVTFTPYITTSVVDLYSIGLATIETTTPYTVREIYTTSYITLSEPLFVSSTITSPITLVTSKFITLPITTFSTRFEEISVTSVTTPTWYTTEETITSPITLVTSKFITLPITTFSTRFEEISVTSVTTPTWYTTEETYIATYTDIYGKPLLTSSELEFTLSTMAISTTTEVKYYEEIEKLKEELRKKEHELKEREKILLEREKKLERDIMEFNKYMKEFEKKKILIIPSEKSTMLTSLSTPVPPTERITIKAQLTTQIERITEKKENRTTTKMGITQYTEMKDIEEKKQTTSVPEKTVTQEEEEIITKRICLNVLENTTIPFDKRRRNIVTKKICLPYFPEKNEEKKSIGRLSRRLLALPSTKKIKRSRWDVPLNFRHRRREKETTRKIDNLQLSNYEWLSNITKPLQYFKGFSRIYKKMKKFPKKIAMQKNTTYDFQNCTSLYEQHVFDYYESVFQPTATFMDSKKYGKRNALFRYDLITTRKSDDKTSVRKRDVSSRENNERFWSKKNTANISNEKATIKEDEIYTVNVLHLNYDEEQMHKVISAKPDEDELTAILFESSDDIYVTDFGKDKKITTPNYKNEEKNEDNEISDKMEKKMEEYNDYIEDLIEDYMNYKEHETSTQTYDGRLLDNGNKDKRMTENKTELLNQAWPTEKNTMYHLGGTRLWELDFVTEPTSVVLCTTDKSKTIDGSLPRTTCFDVVLKRNDKIKSNISYYKHHLNSNKITKHVSIKNRDASLENITRMNALRYKLRTKQPRVAKKLKRESQKFEPNHYKQESFEKKRIVRLNDFRCTSEDSTVKNRKLCIANANKLKRQIVRHKDTNKHKKKQVAKSRTSQNLHSLHNTDNGVVKKKNAYRKTTTANQSLQVRASFSLDEIKALNCSEYKEIQDKIVISMDSDMEEAKEFPQPHYNIESLKGQKYIKLGELENNLKINSELDSDNDVISLPGLNLNLPCNQDGNGITWLSSISRPSYTWKRTDGIALFGFVTENGDLELRNVNAKDTGNYTCVMKYMSPDNEESVETTYEIHLQVVTLPRYIVHGENRYHVRSCDEEDLDMLVTYLPPKLNNIICEADVCNAYVLTPSCSRSQITVNILLVPSHIVKLMTVDPKRCNVFCLKAIQDKLSLILSKNLQIFLEKTIIFRLPHYEQRLVPIVEKSSFARRKRGKTDANVSTGRSSNIGLFSSCPAGYGLRDTHCVPCNVGTYSEDGTSHCKRCPPGTYQPNHGARVCRTCTNPTTKGCYNMLWNSFSAVMVTLASIGAILLICLLLLWIICCAKKKFCVKRIAGLIIRENTFEKENVEEQPLIKDANENEDQQWDSEYRIKKKKGKFYLYEDEWGSHRIKNVPIISPDSYRSHEDYNNHSLLPYRNKSTLLWGAGKARTQNGKVTSRTHKACNHRCPRAIATVCK
ncbi:Melanoma-associated antigen E1 [Acromyrmex echinatior]|uniref:Melanoma-associated antigen E1 n=1 Tax=Acromyrmex echinatior TaxID=103372 RepID=F4WBZ5_ACREC|nr:Melanoma-associated antigen E1 [Acromyrmex echinatior]